MLVEKIDRDPKRNLSLSLRTSVIDRLTSYRDLYHATYGEDIDRSELTEQLLTVALDRDKTFKRYERDQARREKNTAQKSPAIREAAGRDGADSAAQPPSEG